MKPISQHQREILERRVGYGVCPLTAIGVGEKRIGIFADEIPVTIYFCVQDDGQAREGLIGTLNSAQSYKPCSMQFAERCPLYLKNLGYVVSR